MKKFFDSTGGLMIALVSTATWTAALYSLIGFYYEDFDGFIAHLLSGNITEKPLSDFYIYGLTFTDQWIARLHELHPAPWLGIILFIQLMISLFILQTIILIAAQKYQALKTWQMIAISSFYFLCVMMDSFVNFGPTRVSFLAAGSGLMGMLWIADKKTWLSRVGHAAFFFFFALGFLIRFEAGLGACLLIGTFALLYNTPAGKMLRVFIPAGIFSIAILFYLSEKAKEVPFLKAVEPDLYYVADATYKPKYLEGKSREDSIKYEAIRSNLLNDEGELTVDLVKSFAIEKAEIENARPDKFLHGMKVALAVAAPCLKRNFEAVLFNIFLLLVFAAAWHHGLTDTRMRWAFLIYQVFFWLVVLSLAYLVKMENRIFAPMAVLYSTGNILLLLKINFSKINGKKFKVFIVLLFMLCITGWGKAFATKKGLIRSVKEKEAAAVEANRIATGKILMIDTDSRVIIHGTPFHLNSFPGVNKIYMYDSGQLAMVPEYKNYFDRECQCNSARMGDFYQFLFSQKEQLIFASTDIRLRLVEDYLHIVHHLNYEFIKMKGSYSISNIQSWGMPLHYYIIQSATEPLTLP